MSRHFILIVHVVCMPYITRRTFFTARPPKRYGVILSITLLTALFFHEHAHKNRRFHTKFHPHDNHPIVLVVAISNLNDTLSPANKTSLSYLSRGWTRLSANSIVLVCKPCFQTKNYIGAAIFMFSSHFCEL